MDNMDVDSPSEHNLDFKPCDRVLLRLSSIGVPSEYLKKQHWGLVEFVQENEARLYEVVSAILPTEQEVKESISSGTKQAAVRLTMKDRFRESMAWLQWLMFKGEPRAALKYLAQKNVGQRGVCGAVWGSNDIAYRCRTCEHDPTCAICVPCFQNGNHKDHDYSIIYTGGGCCDCGDVTAWKREGFCSKHKGAEQIQPLPEEVSSSVGPVLDALFNCWRHKLLSLDSVVRENPGANDRIAECKKNSNELTFAIVEMLLDFCKHSESLLSFVSKRLFLSDGLLAVLVKGERCLMEFVTKKLHELLLKMLGEPEFKYEFAKVFLSYYPAAINDILKESNDEALKNYPIMSTFSVQILTVPTLTPRLVKEMNLLSILVGCLGDIFKYCAGEDGQLRLSKWGNLYETTLRVLEDIRFVMSHDVVPIYVANEQRDVLKAWLRFLAFVQGMNPQKRESGIHMEEENENMHLPFVLCHSISNINSLLINGACAVSSDEKNGEITLKSQEKDTDDGGSLRHAKIGRLSQESSVSSAAARSGTSACSPSTYIDTGAFHLQIPPAVTWLTYECLRSVEKCFVVDSSSGSLNVLSQGASSIYNSGFLDLKRTFSNFTRGKSIFGRFGSTSDDNSSQYSSTACSTSHVCSEPVNSQIGGQGESLVNSCNAADDNAMETDCAAELQALRFLSMSDWPDLLRNSSSLEISVHFPLHRLLSLILQKALRRCYGESASCTPSSTIFSDFFGHIIAGCHPYGFSAFIMEHLLRIRVFCAEVHAGMWRKHADAPLILCECYRSIRWSGQDLDHDLFLLQCCAAMAPADLYVMRILERFGLSSYLSLNLQRSSNYEPVLVQEMLTLIIQIIKERRFSGLSTAGSLKRELVCKLATGDATHSQLVKSLPRDLSKSDQLQETLDTVAQYSNPSGFNQGMYSLRSAYWKELDLYHPRWSSRELQLAEERYSRFCNTSALTTQLPRWAPVYSPLKGIARVATSKVVFQIIRAVMFYAVFSDKEAESRAPDSVILTALHLLSLGLDICSQHIESADRSCYNGDIIPLLDLSCEEVGEEFGVGGQSLLSLLVLYMRMHKRDRIENITGAENCDLSALTESLLKKFAEMDSGCMTKLQKYAPEIVNHLVSSIPDDGKRVSDTISDNEKRKAKARERQAAILEKMRAEQSKFLQTLDSTIDDTSSGQDPYDNDDKKDPEESIYDVCSLCHDPNSRVPVSYLILLQKSRLSSFVDKGPPSWEQAHGSDKKQTSTSGNVQSLSNASIGSSGVVSTHEVQNVVNELYNSCRPEEAEFVREFLSDLFPSMRNIQVQSKTNVMREKNAYSFETLEEDMYRYICQKMHENMLGLGVTKDNQDPAILAENAGGHGDALLLGKYIAALSQETSENPSPSDSRSSSDSTSQPSSCHGFGPEDSDGIYLSSCGHAVHQGCLDRYLSSLKERYIRRVVFEGGHIVDPDQGEFLCPVCRRLANSVLPVLHGEVPKGVGSTDTPSPLAPLNEEAYSLHLQQALDLLKSAALAVRNGEFIKAFPLQRNAKVRSNLEPVTRMLYKMYFPGKQDKFFGSSRVNQSMIMWDTLKYSLVSTEIAARCGRKSLTPVLRLNSMYRELNSSSGFILSLLLKIVKSTCSKNSLHVIQRFRGIQLLAGAICSGISLDHSSNKTGHSDDLFSVVKLIEMGVSYPDIEFWSQASAPILARDPFSTLMWVLFCLPYPFLSCKESFLFLVHLFYVVSVSQAILACSEKFNDKLNELGLSNCLITDIFEAMGKSTFALQYFVSNYISPSCDIKETIRRFSFPFMRRCALLWKLLNSSTPAPFYDGGENCGEMMYESSHLNAEVIGHELEINEIHELEIMFKIPSLDFILNDKGVRSLVLKWFHHLDKDYKFRSLGNIMYVTPAVPFKLMELPHLYQDLLQRCIKQRCPDCKSVLNEPALCLLCGKLCSPSWKSCCRESGCQSHAMACGAGTGVFLLIRRTTILLQRSARQAPWPSLYLDAFGEEDIEMHRGKPLYLNEERYAALTYLVASHGLDRSSKVLRQTTIGSFFLV